MKKKKEFKKIPSAKVKIFKISNRRGYAAVCLNNLTEGSTAYQTYRRMMKAVRRQGYELPLVAMDKVKRRIVVRI